MPHMVTFSEHACAVTPHDQASYLAHSHGEASSPNWRPRHAALWCMSAYKLARYAGSSSSSSE